MTLTPKEPARDLVGRARCRAVRIDIFGTDNPPDFAAEQNDTSFATGEMSPVTTYYWRVDEKNSAGVNNRHGMDALLPLYICSSPIASDLDGDCRVDLYDYAVMADEWADDILDLTDIALFANDWLTCNREPAGQCWQ